MNSRKSAKRSAFQSEGARIFNARRAAEQMLERTKPERNAVTSLSRDELAALAQQMVDIATIAERYHLEHAQAGSLAPEAFVEPIT